MRLTPRIALPALTGAVLVALTLASGGVRSAVAESPGARTLVLLAAAASLLVGSLLVAHRGTVGFGAVAYLVGVLAIAPQWAGLETAPAAARSLALAAGPLLAPALLHATLALPGGRIKDRRGRLAAAAAWAVTTAAAGAWIALYDPFLDPGCYADCTVNALMVDANPQRANDVHDVLDLAVVVLAVAVVALAARRLAPPARAAAAGLALAAAGVATRTVTTGPAGRFGPADTLAQAAAVAACLVLAGYGTWLLTAPGRTRRRVMDVARGAPGDLTATLRATLGDPALDVAYPLPDGRLVDADGRAIDPAAFRAGRAQTTVTGGSGLLAVIAHEPGTTGLAGKLGAGLRLAIDNERLAALLRAEIERLAEIRRRVVAAADVERRTIERNLHDGAQQQLVALALETGLAAVDAESEELAQQLTAIGDHVDEVLAELRSVAHGIYPAALEDGGLSGVLGSLVRSARTPVTVCDGLAGRRVQRDAEAALYLVAREALRNVDAHAAASGATVTVTHDKGQVRVAVADDGRGGAAIGPRGGLAELADRVGALRGTLRVMDAPRQGTIIEAVIPCGS